MNKKFMSRFLFYLLSIYLAMPMHVWSMDNETTETETEQSDAASNHQA